MHVIDLQAACTSILGEKASKIILAYDELTIECLPENYLSIMQTLRDHEDLHFESLVDLCGVDYSTYKNEAWQGKRFAAVSQLVSVKHNQRVRVRVWAQDDDLPIVPSVVELYNSADWYEREAFDMYGIIFNEHPDLRRIFDGLWFCRTPVPQRFSCFGLRGDAL